MSVLHHNESRRLDLMVVGCDHDRKIGRGIGRGIGCGIADHDNSHAKIFLTYYNFKKK